MSVSRCEFLTILGCLFIALVIELIRQKDDAKYFFLFAILYNAFFVYLCYCGSQGETLPEELDLYKCWGGIDIFLLLVEWVAFVWQRKRLVQIFFPFLLVIGVIVLEIHLAGVGVSRAYKLEVIFVNGCPLVWTRIKNYKRRT